MPEKIQQRSMSVSTLGQKPCCEYRLEMTGWQQVSGNLSMKKRSQKHGRKSIGVLSSIYRNETFITRKALILYYIEHQNDNYSKR